MIDFSNLRRKQSPVFWITLLSLHGAQQAAYAQEPPGTQVSCEGQVISAIEFIPRDPSFLAIPGPLRGPARWVGLIHTTSKPNALNSFLLLEVGGRCTELLRAESERILRIQPFLADATVRAFLESTDGVRVEVDTLDEIPTIVGMRFRGLVPSAVHFGNANLGGQGISLAMSLERRPAYRTGVGLRVDASQVLGRRYELALLAERAPIGSAISLGLGQAFLTDLQRTGWHIGFGNEHRYPAFVTPEGPAVSLGVRRRLWDVGLARRVGLGRHSAFVGLLLTREVVTPEVQAVIASDSGLVVDDEESLGPPVPAYRNVRANAVIGMRALSFTTVRGFDALEGVQDVATGVQLGALIGGGIPRFGVDGDDLFVSADLYVGRGSLRSFAAMRIEGEARRENRTRRWGSVVLSGRLAWYVKPTPEQTFVSSVEFGGGWRGRVPFQLALRDPQGGARGYSASRLAGAWRSVARLEGRWSIGTVGGRGALGIAAFVDGGRVWAGNAPFGVNSGTKVGVGVGLLAAVPPESQRLWRLDVAVPVSTDPTAGWEVRLTTAWAGRFWQEPEDVTRGRAGASPSTIFNWP